MAKKSNRRKKHIPQRTCVGCREVLPKRSLTRIVNGPEGVAIDPTGKTHGRGAYLHDVRACWVRGIKGGLAHALKCQLTEHEINDFLDYMENHLMDQMGAEELS